MPVVVGVFWLLFQLDPDPRGFGTHEKLGLDPCFPMEHWNVPCPGCGVTTSVSLATRGHLWDSFVNQPFGFTIAILMGLYVFVIPILHFRGVDLARWLESPPPRWVVVSGSVLMVAAWAWKFAQTR